MDLPEDSLQYKHSLVIAKRFDNFWKRYRLAIIIYYLIKGPVLLFGKKHFWDDRRMVYSIILVSLSVLPVNIINSVVYILVNLLTCCCHSSLQFKVLGNLYIIFLVISSLQDHRILCYQLPLPALHPQCQTLF